MKIIKIIIIKKGKFKWLKKNIQGSLKGEKFKFENVVISYRKSESIEVDNPYRLPFRFQKVTIEARKKDLKDEIKKRQQAGKKYKYICRLLENKNMIWV